MGANFTKTGFLIGLILYINQLSNAQQVNLPPAPIKWGKISDAEFAIKECSYEKEAKGVVLCDYGKLLIYPSQPVTIKYHKRIKILKEEGLDLANISLIYYSDQSYEKINSLRAQTINTDDRGNTIIREVESKQIFDTKIDENLSEIRFTFPDVKVGSILEYEYTFLTKNFYFLEGWEFQDIIPTIHSELVAAISDQYIYNLIYNGVRLREKFGNQVETGNQWLLKDLPSLKEEPFVWNSDDYAEKILFQMSAHQKYANLVSEYKEVLKDWNGIAKDVMERESMINFLKETIPVLEIIERLNLTSKNNEDKIKAIYEYVNSNFIWDGKFRITPSQTFKELLSSKKGSSSDLNLLIYRLLQEAGIEVYLALISTKTNGLPLTNIPYLNQFNHLICMAKSEDQNLFLDARAAYHPYNLPERMNLNVAAFILDKINPRWMEIKPPVNAHRIVYITHNLTKEQDSEKQGSLSVKFEGYYAVSQRKLLDEAGKEEYIHSKLSSNEIHLRNIQFKNVSEFEQPLHIEADVLGRQTLEEDVIYFNPIYLDFYQDNPFKSDKRYFPVDLIHPDKDTYILNLTIPSQYEVIELPKELYIKLPNNGGSYSFIAKITENTIQISSRVILSRYFFTTEEYPYLKEFYDQIRAKHAEQIVLKKKP